MENHGPECVWRGRRCGDIPGSSSIGSVKEFLRVGDKVCPVGRVFVVIESQKTSNIFEAELCPSITFVAGHPHREIFEPDKDGLRKTIQISILKLLLEVRHHNKLPFLP